MQKIARTGPIPLAPGERKFSKVVKQAVCLASRKGQKVAYGALVTGDADSQTGAFCAVGFINAAWLQSTDPQRVRDTGYQVASDLISAAGLDNGEDWLVSHNDSQIPRRDDARYLTYRGKASVVRRLQRLQRRLEAKGL